MLLTSHHLAEHPPLRCDALSSLPPPRAHIAVATPGHLREMLGQCQCPLAAGVRSLEVLVLDEADRLLDMGFSEW